MINNLHKLSRKLPRRYERKFLYFPPSADYMELEQMVKLHPAGFDEIYYRRQIHNIYFDTLNFDSYYENLFGSYERYKVRIRWYGENSTNVIKPMLEIKIKNNELGSKLSYPLPDFQVPSVSWLGDFLENVEIPDAIKQQLKLFRPTLSNTYTRKYFLSQDRRYRLCIDTDLNYESISGMYLSQNVSDNHEIILEIKYGEKAAGEIAAITNHFPFRLSKKSKYVSGIEALYGFV